MLLADNFKISLDSNTSFPVNKFALSLEEIGYDLISSVVTAIPVLLLVLWWNKETVWVSDPMFVACAKRTTPVYPTGAV